MLTYSPNAGFAGEKTTITGTFLFSDADQDVSQWVVELSDPSGNLVARSPPEPGQSVGQGVTGTVNWTLEWTPSVTGIYHFTTWLVDLAAHESNHLHGEVRIAEDSPYDHNNNP